MQRFSFLCLALLGAGLAFATELPVSDVVLFSTGVGYFQRSGTVKDNATVELTVKSEQVNDLLKSMILLDLDGGQIGAVTYGAQDPVSKTLSAFAVNITDNPTLGQLLGRLRGVPAEATLATGKVSGKIVGIETRKRAVGTDVVDEEVLTLLTDDGLRAMSLDDVITLKLLDDHLNQELQDALSVVARGLDEGTRPVVATFNGTGERRVLIGYATETPIWKTSYRLVTGDKDTQLQGWAVVENTSDTDWNNVNLSLVSGRPISFTQDLYTPLFVSRPAVKPELYTSINPVNYAANTGMALTNTGITNADYTVSLAPSNGYVTENYPSNVSLYNGAAQTSPPVTPKPASRQMSPPAPLRPFYNVQGTPVSAQWDVKAANDSLVSAAVAQDLGQAFAYHLKTPVTLPRQSSAMLPIVSAPVDAKRVSIYNPATHAKFPLYGVEIVNTTGLHLMGGPVTVYNDGVYAGDALIDDLKPGEKRLLSFAIDLGVEGKVETPKDGDTEDISGLAIEKGVLHTTRTDRRTREYTFTVKDGTDRTIVVEHAFIHDWTLKSPAKADEKTDSLYRFFVPVTAKDGGKLDVVEENVGTSKTPLWQVDADTLDYLLQHGNPSPAVKAALQSAKAVQDHQNEVSSTQQQYREEINSDEQEQSRVRENMDGLNSNTATYKMYATKLGDLEARIEKLRAEINRLEDVKAKELQDLQTAMEPITAS